MRVVSIPQHLIFASHLRIANFRIRVLNATKNKQPGVGMPSRRQWLIATAATALSAHARGETQTEVLRYLKAPRSDLFSRYAIELLGLALRRAGLRHRLQAVVGDWMTQGRMELEMARPQSQLDIMWAMTDRSREQALCPVKVPLDRGLLGWRVALIRRDKLALWQTPPTRAELAQRHAGQGLRWPDVEILRANGFQVDTAIDTRNLLQMLRAGRLDYFPRSVLEAQDEVQAYSALQLAIAPRLVIRYPAASYAFLSPQHSKLAVPLTQALESLALDGTLARLFHSYFHRHLESLNLPERHVIDLENPLLPPETPLQRPEFWWHPST